MKDLIIVIAITAFIIIPLEIWYDISRIQKGRNDKPLSTIVRLILIIGLSFALPGRFYSVAFIIVGTYFLLFDFSINLARKKPFFYHGYNKKKWSYDWLYNRIPPQMELLIKGIVMYLAIYFYQIIL